MEQEASLTELREAVRAGAVVITANQRLSRTLRRMYDDAQARSGDRVWPAARVLPIAAWLRATWSEAVLCGAIEPRLLLAPHQAEAIWRRIIEASPESANLLGIREAARSAMEAWRLVHAYRLPWNAGIFSAHEDWSAFHRWADEFREECEQRGFIDEACLAGALAEAARARSFPLPPCLLLAGFDEFTPAQQLLLDVLRDAGCPASALKAPAGSPEIIRSAAPDPLQELRAAARWSRAVLESGAQRIGVVIPRLSSLRDQADRIFTEVLHPEMMHLPEPAPAPVFHVSAGRPLARYPVVAAALEILELGGPALALDKMGSLLQSPFLAGAAAEASSRALLDVRLRRLRRAEVSLETVRRLARQAEASHYAPVYAMILDRSEQVRSTLPRTAPPSEWAASIKRFLEAAGWPGDRTLNSAEYQAVSRWNELVERLASLDIAERHWSFDEALARLRDLADDARFQIEDEDAPVQILGALEAAGATFDHLWVTGLDDRDWPAPARPHPFLPLSLQREHRLPHSSAEREIEFSRQTLARLKASAPQIVFSWPSRDGDVEFRPSPLIEEVPPAPLPSPDTDAWMTRLAERVPLDIIAEDPAPPFIAEYAAGGASILKRQADCPFRAFAEIRLGARALDSGELGISAADRGTAAHHALDLLWSRLQSHAGLLSTSAEELERIAGDCARQALTRDGGRHSGFQRRFLEMEQERLKRLLLDWLEQERPRRPFTVAAREDKRTVEIGGMLIEGRIDRVDRLEDGREIVIDYKSTAPTPSAWADDRPDEPQVPFYVSTLQPSNVAAVAFAHLTPGELRFKGHAAENGVLTGVKAFTETRDGALYDSLAQLFEEWRPRLERLAKEFREGHAAVNPKRGAKTCANCHLDGLCRIRDVGAEAEEDADGA